MAALLCAGCGGPLTANNTTRTVCQHCGRTNEVGTAAIRLPENALNPDDIRRDLQRKAAEVESKRKLAITAAVVLSLLFCTVLAVVLSLDR